MRSKRTILSTLLTGAVALAIVVGNLVWIAPTYAQSSSTGLSADEIAGLQFIREEEKLARDVYLTLYESWDLRVFENISRAEQNHMDSVATLLDRYGIEDPAAGSAIGDFTNSELLALYAQLVETGNLSVADALEVGAAIEEIDILDLQERLAQTENRLISQVYGNLLQGSSNHLRAFVTNLERQTGTAYEPQYMDQSDYDELLSTTTGGARGGQGEQGLGRRGSNGRRN